MKRSPIYSLPVTPVLPVLPVLAMMAILAMLAAPAAIILGYPTNNLETGEVEMIVGGETDSSGQVNITVGPLYRFVFKGIESYGNVGGTADDTSAPDLTLKAVVKDNFSGTANSVGVQIKHESTAIFNTSEKVTVLAPKVDFRAFSDDRLYMTLTFVSTVGGTGVPDGHLNILGESQAEPPPPTGSLYIPAGAYLLEGADPYPEIQVTIVRE